MQAPDPHASHSAALEVAKQFHLTLPKPRESWRLVKEAPTGEIVGIPTFRGKAVITNGILVGIVRETGSLVFGHLDFFVKDRKESTRESKSSNLEELVRGV
jgi:hypothetical protein